MPQPASADPPSGRAAKRCSDASTYLPPYRGAGACVTGSERRPLRKVHSPRQRQKRVGTPHDLATSADAHTTMPFAPLVAVPLAACLSAVLIVLLKPILQRYALARPNARSSHSVADPPRGRHRDRPRHPGDRWAPGIPDAAYASDDGGAGPRSCDGVPRHRGCCRRYQATAGHIETRSSDACGDRPRPVGGGTAPTRDSRSLLSAPSPSWPESGS